MDHRSVESLRRLRDGNERHSEGLHMPGSENGALGRRAVRPTTPVAAVLTCSDPGVCPEILFDQPPDALYVVRAAAHVLDDATAGSLEYAATELELPLIVVLGHDECRMVATALREPAATSSLGVVLDALEEPVLRARHAGWPLHMLLSQAVRENVIATMSDLRNAHIIHPFVDDGSLHIVGAVYRERSGRVEWLDNPPGI